MLDLIVLATETDNRKLQEKIKYLKNIFKEERRIIISSVAINDKAWNCIVSESDETRLSMWLKGMEFAKNEYVCLLHDDVELSRQSLKQMCSIMELDDMVGAVNPKTNNNTFHSNAISYDIKSEVKNISLKKNDIPNTTMQLHDFCILARRDVLLQALKKLEQRKYNSSLFVSILLSWEIMKQGYLLAIADTIVEHASSGMEDMMYMASRDKANFQKEYDISIAYSSLIRTDILKMVLVDNPQAVILDVGCSCGGNLMLLRTFLRHTQLYGIEINPVAADVANSFGSVLCEDVEKLDRKDWQNKFDIILIGDCLEHLHDPWNVLGKIVKYLKPTGEIIISLPNINHISILKYMIDGRFPYEDAGILDRTHLRFFTREGVEMMLGNAGLEITNLRQNVIPLDEREVFLRDTLTQLSTHPQIKKEFESYQYIAKAQRIQHFTSIVIINHNLYEYTKNLINSIRQFTPAYTYEIIVVDNGSTDASLPYLIQQNDVKVIINEENKGFPMGCNQGMKAARGNEILLLNNDTLVTPNWLSNLRNALYSDSHIGAVGPMTNYCSNGQQIEVPYDNKLELQSMRDMEEFASRYNVSDSSKWHKWMKLVGYCMLIRREVYEKVGDMDERFSPGNYEDDDYSMRIRQAGYELLLCEDTFIHHFGSVSFGVISEKKRDEFIKLNAVNRQKFLEKYHLDEHYGNYHSFIADIKLEGINGAVIIYNSGSSADLYNLASNNPGMQIYGTTKNKYDLQIASSFPLLYVADINDFLSVLKGKYVCIIIAEDWTKVADKNKFIEDIENFLLPNGWLVYMNENEEVTYMQKE